MTKILSFFRIFLIIYLPFSSSGHTITFRNHAMQLPSLNWLGMDSSQSFLNSQFWQSSDIISVGVGYRYALDYSWWIGIHSALGFSQHNDESTLLSLHVHPYFRYNFLLFDWKPFIDFGLHYMQLFAQNRPIGPQNHQAVWLGIGPAIGIEWSFSEAMGIEALAEYKILFHFNGFLRHQFAVTIAYLIYF